MNHLKIPTRVRRVNDLIAEISSAVTRLAFGARPARIGTDDRESF